MYCASMTTYYKKYFVKFSTIVVWYIVLLLMYTLHSEKITKENPMCMPRSVNQ